MFNENTARRALEKLIEDYHLYPPDRRAQFSEADVVRQFLDRLFRDVLGWPIEDNNRYKYELSTRAGRPDMTFIPESGGTIFIEAKRFGVIRELKQARQTITGTVTPGQMALPGMSVDRTPEEQQAINYAFENNGTWAILTNFERLRVFNARRDWLVFSFETPDAYLGQFDLLARLAYPNILRGSLDEMSNQRYTVEVDTDYLAFINDSRQDLARDLLAHEDKNPWLRRPDGRIDLRLLRDVVQRFLDRLVIVRFAEDHFVIPAGTLYNMFELAESNPYTFSMDEFIDRLFRRFDQQHNSALFAPGMVDKAEFSDEVLRPLVEKLYEARYRAMPADILGNTYEQYLGKTLAIEQNHIVTRDNLETRKKQGSYYTPQVIVRYMVDQSLGRYLYGTTNGQPDGTPLEGETRKTAADIRDLRVLDAACGSGSFLIYAYEVLAKFYESERARLEAERLARKEALARDGMFPTEIEADSTVVYLRVQLESIAEYPRLILEQHLYGVDLDPQAAEIAVVNLMMRGMERRQREKRLPLILNQNVKVGNSLIGLRPDDPRLTAHAADLAHLIRLRADLIATPHNTPEHDAVIRDLEAATEALYEPFAAEFAAHFSDVGRIHPFHWGVEFPEVFYNTDGTPKDNPGFAVVIGNPPWEVVQPDLREFYAQFDPHIESRFTREQAEARIIELNAADPDRNKIYDAQVKMAKELANYFKVTEDYKYQGKGKSGTHKLFTERMYSLLIHGGRIGYVVPSGIYMELGTKDLREMLLNEGNIQYIFSFSNERFFFPGVDHRFKFALLGAEKGQQTDGFWAAFRFNPRVAVAPDNLLDFLNDKNNLVYVKRQSLERFSPESLSLMEFQTQYDYAVTEKLYANTPLLSERGQYIWNIRLNQEFNFTTDRHLLNQKQQGIPFYEGKMIHQYDAFYAAPHFWIGEEKLASLSTDLREQLRTYRVAHRRIARSTDERTLIAAIVPPNSACEVNATVMLIEGSEDQSLKFYACALLNSLTLDFVLRYKVSTTLNMFHIYTLPLPRLTAGNPTFDAIVPRAARLTCTRAEFADLWGAVMGSSWDESSGATDPAERQRLRDELDALVAHLYGLTRDDYAHILTTFPLAVPDETRRSALLGAYDRMGADMT
jgi:hypothetical protein